MAVYGLIEYLRTLFKHKPYGNPKISAVHEFKHVLYEIDDRFARKVVHSLGRNPDVAASNDLVHMREVSNDSAFVDHLTDLDYAFADDLEQSWQELHNTPEGAIEDGRSLNAQTFVNQSLDWAHLKVANDR